MLSGIPFKITDAAVASWGKLLRKRFGTLNSYRIHTRKVGAGFDGSVILGFDLGDLPKPAIRPNVPLIYGGKHVLTLYPKLRQVRVVDESNCPACPAFGGACKDPDACAAITVRELAALRAKQSRSEKMGRGRVSQVQPPKDMMPPPPPSAKRKAAGAPPAPPPPKAALKTPPQDDPARADRTLSCMGYDRCTRVQWEAAERGRRGKQICQDYMSNSKVCVKGRSCPLYHHGMPPPSAGGGSSA